MKLPHVLFLFQLIGPAFLFSGCEKGDSHFSDLDSNKIPRPTLNGKISDTLTLNSSLQVISLSGECDSRVDEIEIQFKDLSDWNKSAYFSVTSPQIKCKESTHSFILTLKSMSLLGFWLDLKKETHFQINLRSQTRIGSSGSSVVTVYYQPNAANTQPPKGTVSSGAGTSTSSHFKMKGHVNPGASISTSSTHYQLEGVLRY